MRLSKRNLEQICSLMMIICLNACQSTQYAVGTIASDCSGTYVIIKDKHYNICNWELVDEKEDGDKFRFKYESINSCLAYDTTFHCMLYHENEGWIVIKKIAH
jgi:hypothetical protein